MHGKRIGIDLGGTKIEALLLDLDGAELARIRVPTPRQSYPDTLRAIAGLVAELEAGIDDGGRATIGVGVPGSLSPATGLIRNANSTWLNGQRLDRDLATLLGREVRLQNDANCLAVSEAVDGAGAGARLVFAAILGTGVGAGVAIDGRAWPGRNGVAGEWGHSPLPWMDPAEAAAAPRCWCGLRGCLEQFLSGPALAAEHAQTDPSAPDMREIAQRADAGDVAAAAVLLRAGDRLGRALAVVVNLLDPDIIVLGGGLSNVAQIYPPARAALAAHAFSDRITTEIAPALHGDSSGVRGAAWLWPPDGG